MLKFFFNPCLLLIFTVLFIACVLSVIYSGDNKVFIILIHLIPFLLLLVINSICMFKLNKKYDRLSKEKAVLENKNAALMKEVDERNFINIKQEEVLHRQSHMASMGEMVGIIAHQWRQPLSTLGIFVQDIEDSYLYDELDENYIKDVVEKSMAQISYMSRTIDDFRSFFKEDASRELFDIAEAVKDTVDLVMPYANVHMVNVMTDVKPAWIFGVVNEFKQALLNIINNSNDAVIAEHTEESNRQISIYSMINSDNTVSLYIDDTGGGVSSDVLNKVFDAYFTTKGETNGTGIGLYMAKLIVEKHMNGEISMMNIPGGARVILTFEIKRGLYE